MTAPVFIYVPHLHEARIPAALRGRVLCFPCGLPESREYCGPDIPAPLVAAREKICSAQPLGAPESRAVLEELLRLGEEHGQTGILREADVVRRMDDASRKLSREEKAALDAFALSDGEAVALAALGGREDKRRKTLLRSQKILLLAHCLEGRLLELDRLEQRVSRAEASLHAALGEKDAALAPESDGQNAILPISWRLVLEAMCAFLPDNATLFTADAAMIRDLQEEETLGALPEDRAELAPAWAQDCVKTLLYARLPAWRLAGRRACPAGSFPLGKKYEILAASIVNPLSV